MSEAREQPRWRTHYVKAAVQTPRPPNFLLLEAGNSLPVGAVEDDDLRRIGEAWTEALIARAHEQRADWRGEEAPDGD